jgi:hypothetical protein
MKRSRDGKNIVLALPIPSEKSSKQVSGIERIENKQWRECALSKKQRKNLRWPESGKQHPSRDVRYSV